MNLTVGPRYAFFLNGGSSPEYQYAMKVGTGCMANLKAQLSNSANNETNGHHLNKIKTYIDFIKGVALSAQTNEINFIKKINSIYDEKYLGKELKQHFTTLLAGIEEGNFNYIQFMSVLSDFMHHNDKHYKERIERYHTNMQVIDHNYQILKEKAKDNTENKLILESIQEAHDKNYHSYRGLAVKNLIDPITNEKNEPTQAFQTSVSTLISNRFKSVMKALMRSDDLKEIIIQQVLTSGLSSDKITAYIRTAVLQWISSLDLEALTKNSGQDLALKFITQLQTNYQDMMKNITNKTLDTAAAIFNSKQKHSKETASFEEIALTTGKGLADLFENLDQDSKQKIINLNPQLLSELHRAAQTEKNRSTKMQFTSALKDTIRNTFEQLGFKMPDGTKEEIRAAINKFIKSHNDILGTTNIKKIITDGFTVNSTGGSMAEWLGANGQNIFGEVFLGGSKTKFKTDMSVTITWNEDLKFDFADDAQKNELKQNLSDFIPNMFEEMKKLNLKKGNKSEQTDVQVQVQAYLNTMTNIKNLINKLESTDQKDEEQRQHLLEQLSSFFLESISVKDYDFYETELGVHGGSLGGGNAPENVINNITLMYQLGGISPIDVNLLMFGVMNCANGMIAAGIEEDIATYLLGGAAMIMFDEGFTDSEVFLNSVKKEFGFAMVPLHLYRLQGRIVPASYIYSSIYNNLCKVYHELSTETSLDTLSTSRNRVIITNSASSADIVTTGTIQEQWDKTASNVESKVSIKFAFMAGLLDIFDAIPQAFNIE